MDSLSCKIDDLDYGTVEQCITEFFDMDLLKAQIYL